MDCLRVTRSRTASRSLEEEDEEADESTDGVLEDLVSGSGTVEGWKLKKSVVDGCSSATGVACVAIICGCSAVGVLSTATGEGGCGRS